MADLIPQIVSVPLYGGQDSSIDAKMLQPGNNAKVYNGRLDKRGVLRKRFGYLPLTTQIAGGGNITKGRQIFSAGQTLFQHDGQRLYSWSPDGKAWTNLGSLCSAAVNVQSVAASSAPVSEIASASTAVATVSVWIEGTSAYYSVLDNSTGTLIQPRKLLSLSASGPNVVTDNANGFYLSVLQTSLSAAVAVWALTFTDLYTLNGPVRLSPQLASQPPLTTYAVAPNLQTGGVEVLLPDGTTTIAGNNLLTFNEATASDTGSVADWQIIGNINLYNVAPSGSPTLTSVTSVPWGAVFQGSNCLHFTETTGNYQDGPALFIPVSPGTQYTFSVYYGDTFGGNVQIAATDNTGANANFGISSVANTWQRLSVTLTTGPGATTVQLSLSWATRGGNQNWYADAWMFNLGPTALAWDQGPIVAYHDTAVAVTPGLVPTYNTAFSSNPALGTALPVIEGVNTTAASSVPYLGYHTQDTFGTITLAGSPTSGLPATGLRFTAVWPSTASVADTTVSPTAFKPASLTVFQEQSYIDASNAARIGVNTYTAVLTLISGVWTYVCTKNGTTQFATAGDLRLQSHGYAYDGNSYAWCLATTNATVLNNQEQNQLFKLDQSGSICSNVLEEGSAGGYANSGIAQSQLQADSNGQVRFAALQNLQLDVQGTNVTYVTGGIILTEDFSQAHVYPVYLNGLTYLSGESPATYDGATLNEWGFFYAPPASGLAEVPGGGNLAGGEYGVQLVYAAYDATGQLWRSSTSFTQTITIAAGSAIAVTVPYLSTTARQNVVVEIYTTYNFSGSVGVVYAKAGEVANVSDPRLGVSTLFEIVGPDADFATGEPLYTAQGQVPDNQHPGALNYLTSSGTRLYGLSGETHQVLVSNIAGGVTPANFGFGNSVTIPLGNYPVNSCAILYGRLYLATQQGWFYTNADGTTQNAPFLTFDAPIRLPLSGGVADPRSVHSTATGIFYQNRRGIQLLNGQQQPSFVGEPIKDVTDAVGDAYTCDQIQQIRFRQGNTLACYDFNWGTWLFHTFPGFTALQSTCLWSFYGAALTPDGTAWVETPANFFDGAVPISPLVETPWVSGNMVGGWGRAWRVGILGNFKSPHTLQVRIATNYEPAWKYPLLIDGTTANNGLAFGGTAGRVFGNLGGFGANPAGNAYQFLGVMPEQKAAAFKFEISVVESTGEDCELNVLALLVGVLPNLAQVPVGKKFG